MTIRGRLIHRAPHFSVRLRFAGAEGDVWFLADTGAARTTILDRDATDLGIPGDALEPMSDPIVGIGGPVRSWLLRGTELVFPSTDGPIVLRHDICVTRHDVAQLSAPVAHRVLRLPSILARDIIDRKQS